MKRKPALLSGTDSIRLRLVNVDADEVFQLCNYVDQINSGAPNSYRCAPNPQPSKVVKIPNTEIFQLQKSWDQTCLNWCMGVNYKHGLAVVCVISNPVSFCCLAS